VIQQKYAFCRRPPAPAVEAIPLISLFSVTPVTQKRNRILFLASWFPNRWKPALGNFIQRHASAAALHDAIAVLHVSSGTRAGEPAYVVDTGDADGVFLVVVYYRKPRIPVPGLRLWRYFRAHLIGYRRVRAHFGGHPDLVHLNVILPAGLFARYLRRMYGIPYVITEHSTVFKTGLPGAMRRFVRRTGNRAFRICPVSSDLGRAMAATGIRTPQQVIPNVVDTDLFRPGNRVPGGRKIILHVSTLDDRQKNITGLLHAIARLAEERDDFELHLVSELPPDAAVDTARNLGVYGRVVFIHRYMPLAEVATRMRGADAFVLFSRYENLPCVLIEAMASSVPVVSTDVGGIREHVLPEFGMLVPSEDEKRLLESLRDVLNEPGRFDTAGMRRYAETHFSRQAVGAALHRLYEEILALPR